MHFKHPEVLYFLFLLLLPILVHLFQLRRFKTELFTNVRFLKELVVQTRKSSKLKKYLLLATRLLLFTFLILAFAQPFFEAKDHKNANNELYIILDNSFSMQAKGKKGELLKRAVQDLLEQAPENTQFSLITCTDNFWNTDIKSIQKELQNLTYSATPFQPESLLAKVKAHPSAFKKDIVIITDGVGLESKSFGKPQADENVYFILPEAENTNNIAIDSVYLHQTLDQFYEIGVAVTAHGDDFKDIPLAIYNQGKLVAKTLVNFDQPKQQLKFNLPKEDFHGYVSLNDNALEYDNTYYFSLSKPQKNNVFSIGDNNNAAFLGKIYTTDEFNYTHYELRNLDYNAIEKQDAVILNELPDIPASLQTTLKTFVAKGGNVVVIPAANANTTAMNALTKALGGGYTYGNWKTEEQLISKINFNHPLYSQVFEKKTDNFQYPKTKASYRVQSSLPSVLEYNDQSPFLSATTNGIANIYYFAAPIDKDYSNFCNSPYLIVPTFYNMALSAQKVGINALVIGDSKPFITNSILGKDEIVSITNANESFIPVQQIMNQKVKLTFNDNPKTAGNYQVDRKGQFLENLSFNYARTESNLNNRNTAIADEFKEIESTDHLFDTLQADRNDTQIWKWFLLLTLLFALVEIAIQKWMK
ncbi:MAG: BatA domain-containing protein [Flavobacterium stagni]